MASWPAASRRRSSGGMKSAELSGSGASYGYGRTSSSPDACGYGRQFSAYSARSSQVSRSGSFSAAAQRVAGAFTGCFVPRRQVKAGEEEEEEEKKSKRSMDSGSYHGWNEANLSAAAGSWQEGRALTIADVSKATSNFSEKNVIRQGRSSTMYRGKLRDGSQIAVKCVTKDTDALILRCGKNPAESCGNGLELAQRLNIAIDVAQAITYLHEYKERPIIHGGIRSSGVLLTDALAAKVAGFGLAGTAASGSGSGSDATPARSAAGYVDPEYLITYQLTDKSDVYAFGVLLVELATGRPPVERSRGGEARLTTKWALQKCRAGEAVVAMDPRMRRSPASVAAVERTLALAAQSVAAARDERPSMRRCSELLWTIRRDYHRQEEPRCGAVAAERSDEWVIR
ncbi:Receptor protein kinase TMK1 [Zea mays]|uniref:Receptor protein kinase TMK1 n=1 Tax=Zea mays TaxID=4577 RepID=A0A1D6GE03_MAIZE|nr:Receptor protein kinase TMK1 [Zea mays]